MKKNWKLITCFIILISLIILLLITAWLNKLTGSNIDSVILEKDNSNNYDNILINNYSDYENIIENYHILGKLSINDFQENDYIISFIPYIKNMKIDEINVNINQNIIIEYKTNPKITNDSSKVLVNFIPIKKDLVNKNIIIENKFN